MPKEQGERLPRMASKNAKDRSNSATLLAARAKAQAEQEANGRGSRCSSEKDSGYSGIITLSHTPMYKKLPTCFLWEVTGSLLHTHTHAHSYACTHTHS